MIDGIAVVQKCKPTGKTFEQIQTSEILELTLSITKQAERIDTDFDVFRELPIKNEERLSRLSPKLNFSRIVFSQVIRQCNNFLSSSQNKIALIHFPRNDWR